MSPGRTLPAIIYAGGHTSCSRHIWDCYLKKGISYLLIKGTNLHEKKFFIVDTTAINLHG